MVPISIRPNDKQKVQVGNSLENNCSDKSKKVDQQNNHHKSTGLATGIELPHDHDVISGRGNFYYHPGNHRFRNIICKIKKEYMKGTLDEKKTYTLDVIDKIKSLNPPGRFLKQDITCARRSWYELGEKDTYVKTRQALLKKVGQQNNHHKSIGLATGIELPHDHDVINGRGNYSFRHPGNHRFRNIICKIKKEDIKSTLDEKKKYAQDVIDKIKSLNPPGRFLKQDITCARRSWYELGEKDTLIKTRQALRESWSNHPIEKEKAMKKKRILR